ncbi:MAG: hypothetical protein M3063_05945 [Actinomycetota bacterium]|nr:hypothetical protein [Actinomycetota bacterium]
MTDRSPESHPTQTGAEAAPDGSAILPGPLIAYYGPEGQIAYHPAPPGYQPPTEVVPALSGGSGQPPDAGWAALREAVWESGQVRPDPPPSSPQAAPLPSEAATTAPVTTVVAAASSAPSHKIVPRPTAAHRITAGRSGSGFRPSREPYRIGVARRLRSGFALIVLSVFLAGLLTAVLVAVVAGIASAISHAASS